MEWFQVALERYRQERPLDGYPSLPTPGAAKRVTPAPIVYTRTRSVEIPESFLRERRILAGFQRGPYVDAFKILRTQVMHRLREKGWNVVGVTSPGQHEGKTLTALNLAVSLAMDITRSVLLVDANLQNPTVHDMLGLGECEGLADYLLDDVPIEDLLVHPGINRLVVLPGGRAIPNTAEALTSPKMTSLVEEVKRRYQSRVIIYDLPPLLHGSDVLAFSPSIDALLVVVEEGRTKSEDVERALSLVKNSTHILGTVLNKAEQVSVTPTLMRKLLPS
ncbi:MAG: CpsD/CapB family tyrosine-protein kinase [Nitrospira sp.]